MMKYQHPVYPVFITGMICWAASLFRADRGAVAGQRRTEKAAAAGAIILLAAFTCYYYRLGDGLLLLNRPAKEALGARFVILYASPVILAMAGAFFYSAARKSFSVKPFVVMSFFLIFPASIALDLRQTAPYTTAESWLNYGESGLRETAGYLSTRISADTPCILRKDIVYYLKLRHGIDTAKNKNPTYLFRDKPLQESVRDFLQEEPPAYIVMDPVVLSSNPFLVLVGNKLFNRYRLDEKIGNFMVLRRMESA